MSNFGFLKQDKNSKTFALFADAAVEAEKVYSTSPAMCAIGCRKALELAVKWVYEADFSIHYPVKENLQSLLNEPSFKREIDNEVWRRLVTINKIGNNAVHTEKIISQSDAIFSLRSLFDFVQWIDYCYGEEYEERTFDAEAIPRERVIVDTKRIKEQESLLNEKDSEIEKLRKQVESQKEELAKARIAHEQTRTFHPEDISEEITRKVYIDQDLKTMGWLLPDSPNANVSFEYQVMDMEGVPGQNGFIDYVLWGKDGLPLAIIEAKRTSKDAAVGKQQAKLYADSLERKYGRRPMIFYTNGFETYFWDDVDWAPRRVSMVFSQAELQRFMNRRSEKQDPSTIEIDNKITDRYYQKEAIHAVCDHLKQCRRKHLLVMATGTGKTRTASSLTDVLSRAGYVTNTLFLADRTALVRQAKEDFKNYLPNMSLCNLCNNKEEYRNARIVFSTYPTMLNAIVDRLFGPAHFDLIIIDESHRSIFKKYQMIFEYFDAILVGLTATPKSEVGHNTYQVFDLEDDCPTYSYDYERAVHRDHVLVPFFNYEVKTQFLEQGIHYDSLSEEDKERYEEDFAEDEGLPEVVPSEKLNRFVFNQATVDEVIQDLMERGIKVEGGDRIGKSIIFAQNKRHAEYIVQRFDALYPQYKGKWARRIVCDDAYAQSLIDEFKVPDKPPYIAVSVDMMDTGIDVRECVNLVFFKQVKSKTKFWQMIGRGTRLCDGLSCVDEIDGEYEGKKRFLIFDYCGNFQFFRENPQGYEGKDVRSLTESIFIKKVLIVTELQKSEYTAEPFQQLREKLVSEIRDSIESLNPDHISVKMQIRYVEKYKDPQAYVCLSEENKQELITYLAPLIESSDPDEAAKRFDSFMFGLILKDMGKQPAMKTARQKLCETATQLEKVASIPQVAKKLPEIEIINTWEYWETGDVVRFDKTREELRDLIKFLITAPHRNKIIYTNLSDPIVGTEEGKVIDQSYGFDNYRARVNRYFLENGDLPVIKKLYHNIPLTVEDDQKLEEIFTCELGSKEDYQKEYGSQPYGFVVRHICKLDNKAVAEAFKSFTEGRQLKDKQKNFLERLENYISKNGYMDNISVLSRPPFDKPYKFVAVFNEEEREKLIRIIKTIKENAQPH